jgi:hypothetical protein
VVVFHFQSSGSTLALKHAMEKPQGVWTLKIEMLFTRNEPGAIHFTAWPTRISALWQKVLKSTTVLSSQT